VIKIFLLEEGGKEGAKKIYAKKNNKLQNICISEKPYFPKLQQKKASSS